MKKWITVLISMVLLMSCARKEELEVSQKDHSEKEQSIVKKEEPPLMATVPLLTINNQMYISLEELSNFVKLDATYDATNQTLSMLYTGHPYFFIFDVPVFQKGIDFFPMERSDFNVVDEKPYLSIQFIQSELQLPITVHENNVMIALNNNSNDIEAITLPKKPTTVEEVTTILSVLQNPIIGAQVSTKDSHLPGAPRSYRNGYHEGMDFYGYSSGVTINRETPIYAMGEGTVIRADHDYESYPSEEARNEDLSKSWNQPITPEYILDKLRGRQVWIRYPGGILARFSHLDRIPEDIQVGDTVDSEKIVGYVGNSGTSGEVKKDDSELHLHLDILIYGELFWEGLNSSQVREILTNVFE
ncbi:M23 family metallopeptidase [Bacillus salitolerans]|uniref:M23 family metallopeptidase n=1 Tax=Bacillus salitolerans TaxID=1437434 RepID=A0ABW4LKB3_9BACI